MALQSNYSWADAVRAAMLRIRQDRSSQSSILPPWYDLTPAAVKFFCLHPSLSTDIQTRLHLLESACASRGISFVPLQSDAVDHCALPTPEWGNIVYNVGRGSHALEGLLLQPGTRSIYPVGRKISWDDDTTKWAVVHQLNGLPMPKTIHDVTSERIRLTKYVNHLGGFPVIVKVRGGTRGVGVMRVDSFSSLFSVIDQLVATRQEFVMREWVDTKSCVRCVVLGDEVLAAVEYFAPPDDFRSSIALAPHAETCTVSPAVLAVAVESVHQIGATFGGVDIAVDSSGSPYLLEVNCPFSFQTPQRLSGVDIAGRLVEHLRTRTPSDSGSRFG